MKKKPSVIQLISVRIRSMWR